MHVLELDELDDLNNLDKKRDSSLETLCSSDISYNAFFKKFLYQNEPCIIRKITDDWPCQELWIDNDKPNLDYLESSYGSSVAPVANCDERYFNSQSKVSMTLSDFSSYWRKYSYSTMPNNEPCLYLKDWHFMKEYPDEEIYNVPEYFASDWLNEYLVREPDFEDDYRFVYMGPRGSWTPFHSDVFSSFSWSVNICGKKKWAFFQPGSEDKLRDRFGKLTYSIDNPDLENTSLFPNYDRRSNNAVVLIQEVGDAVFVPSGWHHQVWNLEDTISINHNWINSCNIDKMWRSIMKELLEVEKEIEDCRDMENWTQHCQLLLKSVHGMDVAGFCSFVFYIANVRLDALKNNSHLKTRLSRYSFGRNHLLFDLFSLQNLFQDMLNTHLPCLMDFEDTLRNLIESINSYKL